jgi:ribonuclease BN (tRNA processing enzyme)
MIERLSHARSLARATSSPLRPPRLVRPSLRGSTGRALLAACLGAATLAIPLAPPLAAQTRVVVLGSGTPNADPERSGPAVAIVVGPSAYLVDAGPGVVRRAAQAARDASIPALLAPRLNRVFLTHLHSDHTTGLADLILAPWVLDRATPLDVYGPPGTKRMTDLLVQAYSEDIDMRLHGGEPANKTGYGATAHDVGEGVVYRDSLVTVTALGVPHGEWKHALGYRFQTADRTIVVSGDTRASDAVVRACNGCDVLVHEVISAEGLAKREPAWQRYHGHYHTTTYELADIAERARPKLLVLYHQVFSGVDDAALLREVRSRYRGAVVSSRDLGVY